MHRLQCNMEMGVMTRVCKCRLLNTANYFGEILKRWDSKEMACHTVGMPVHH